MAKIRRIFGRMGTDPSDSWSDCVALPAQAYAFPSDYPSVCTAPSASAASPSAASNPLNITLPQVTVTASNFPWATIVIGLAIAAYFAFFYKPSRARS